jgi:Fe2+ or Zn2+ uptake regulation protein
LTSDTELRGTTRRVYVILMNENKRLGPRELMHLAKLSSPSVAYRQLQKLEDLGLVKNARAIYGKAEAPHQRIFLGSWKTVSEKHCLLLLLHGHFKRRDCDLRRKVFNRGASTIRFHIASFRNDGSHVPLFNRRHIISEAIDKEPS